MRDNKIGLLAHYRLNRSIITDLSPYDHKPVTTPVVFTTGIRGKADRAMVGQCITVTPSEDFMLGPTDPFTVICTYTTQCKVYLSGINLILPAPIHDRWYVGAFSYDGITTRLYLDGKLCEETETETATSTDASFIIGPVQGAMGEIRFYNRKLPNTELYYLNQSIRGFK